MRESSFRRPTGAGPARLFRAACYWLVALVGLAAAPASEATISAVDGGVQFTYENPAAGQVFWVGEFNGWNTSNTPFAKEGDAWVIVLPLPPGEYQYKFVVDGAYIADPDNSETKGEYGNSFVVVGADGKPRASGGGGVGGAVSSLNPKIKLGGRLISTFKSSRDTLQDNRYELTRPDFDLDLDFNIKMSEVLDARVLTNIRGDQENVPFYQTRLNFDRGYLHLHSDRIDLYAFDNDRLDDWGDPLDLVGSVGIYNHEFGYFQQGLQAAKTIGGIDNKLLYSDNFRTGGTSRPADVSSDQEALFNDRLAEGQDLVAAYSFTDTDDNKDVLAYRGQRAFGAQLDAGIQARLDRGFNPGVANVTQFDDTSHASGTSLSGPTYERWRGLGANLAWKTGAWTIRGEYLNGRDYLDFQNGTTGTRVTIDDGDTTTVELAGHEALESFEIATDNRGFLGALGSLAGLDLDLSWTYHGTDVTPIGNDSALFLDNRMMAWSAEVGRTFALNSDRVLEAQLGLQYIDFEYDAGSPWTSQFWFDRRNFWLEAGEHEVSVDRMVLLGGNDVASWRPSIAIDLLTNPGLKFRYAGVINSAAIDEAPKYVESLFQLTLQTSSKTRFYSDTRWVKYDDPVLAINQGYVSTFLEFDYQLTPGIHFALSWGVDPDVIDEPVNEFAYIGRDKFIFDRMATGSQAARDYYSLGNLLPQAEQALEDIKIIQLQAVVQF